MIDTFPFEKKYLPYFVKSITPRTLEEETGSSPSVTRKDLVEGMREMYRYRKEMREARKRAPEYDGTGQ